ncbi:MAG: amphi-Trp domain-containing protein [Alphaproteobacteria bacterium]|jgi:amphi-Trp domain-containing protein|nr:MAG: amphi-Trp domain-containing protein [Alphaproteobacteria bacterium]
MARKPQRDVEKTYTRAQFVAKLRRFADSLEQGEPFAIQIAGERVRVPARAVFTIEHERDSEGEEIEFQMKWKPEA